MENLNDLDDRRIFDYLFPEDTEWAEPFRILIEERVSEDDFSISSIESSEKTQFEKASSAAR